MEKEPLLTGCYLLVVLAEPICEDHKEKVIQRVAKGLLSWNTNETDCDLKEIENAIQNRDKNSRDHLPEILLQHSTEKLAVEVLLSPSVSTLKQCMKNMFLSPTAHKHLIHGGYSFTGTGSWMLDDGLFSFDDFLEILDDNSVRDFLESYSDSMFTLHIHCSPVGQWVTNDLKAQTFSKFIRMELNPSDSPTGVKGAAALLDFLDESLKHLNLDSKMSSTEFIGNIRFSRPTLYIFPSGQGDCSLFGVSGFTMLIDGGFTPFPSFWNFIRHLERLDALMVTRLSEDNLWGVSSLFKKKILKPIYPQIGYIFCNIAEGNKDLDKKQSDSNELLLSVIGIGQELLGNVKQIGLKPLQCLREPLSSIEPMTLYHKVGLGTLQMYILSPPRDDKILKEFLNHWSSGKESFSLVRTGSASHKKSDVAIPLSNLMSICCLLVWKPSDPNEEITRMLFPGSAPQSRIFEGLNKIEKLDIFCQQKCTQSSIKTINKTDVKPSSKQNRFRSVSPISRVKPYNVRQQSAEPEKPKTLEEKYDTHYIQTQNIYKTKPIKQMAVNKIEKKDLQKESMKKVVSNVKTEPKKPKTESVPEKRSVSQSPKKVLRNKKINQTKQNASKTEDNKTNQIKSEKKLSLTLNGIESQNQIVDRVNEKRKSLEMDHEFQNKLLHSEYLKDDMEPDSLESIITDGKISKDSLEVSEDEISSDKFINKTDEEFKAPETVIEEEELKTSITTISSDINVLNIDSKSDNIEDNSVQFDSKTTEQTEQLESETERQSLDDLTKKRDSISSESQQIISESDTTPVQTEEEYEKFDKNIELKDVITEKVTEEKSSDLQNQKQQTITDLNQTEEDLSKNQVLDRDSEEIEIKEFIKEQIELDLQKQLDSKSTAEDSIETKKIDSKDSKIETIVEKSQNKNLENLSQPEISKTETGPFTDLSKEVTKDEVESGQIQKNTISGEIKAQEEEDNKEIIKKDSIESKSDEIKTNEKQSSAGFSDKQKEIDSKDTSLPDMKDKNVIIDSIEDNKQKEVTKEIKDSDERGVTKGVIENQSVVSFNEESLDTNIKTIEERIDSIRADSETGHTMPSTNISQGLETNKTDDMFSEEKQPNYELEFLDKLTLTDTKHKKSDELDSKQTEIIGFEDLIKEKSNETQNKTTDDSFTQNNQLSQISTQVSEKDSKVTEIKDNKPLKEEEFKEELEFKDSSGDSSNKTISDSQQNIEFEETLITIVNEPDKLAQRKSSTDHTKDISKDLSKDLSIDPKEIEFSNITDDIKSDIQTEMYSQVIAKDSKDYIEVKYEEPKTNEKQSSSVADQIVNDVNRQQKSDKEIKKPSEEELKPKDLAQEIKETEERESKVGAEVLTTQSSQTSDQKPVISENICPVVLSDKLEIKKSEDSSKETVSKEQETKKPDENDSLIKVTTDNIQVTEKSSEIENKSIQMDISFERKKSEEEIKSNEKQNLKNDSKIMEIKDVSKNIQDTKTDKLSEESLKEFCEDLDKTKSKDITEQKTIETSEPKISIKDMFSESDKVMDSGTLLEQKIGEKQEKKDSVQSISSETQILEEIKPSIDVSKDLVKDLSTNSTEIKSKESLLNKSDLQTELGFSQQLKDKDSKDKDSKNKDLKDDNSKDKDSTESKYEESKTVEKQISSETSDKIETIKNDSKQTNVKDLDQLMKSDEIDLKVKHSKDKSETDVSLKDNFNQFKEFEETKSSKEIPSEKSTISKEIVSSNKTDEQIKIDSQTDFGSPYEIIEITTKDSDQTISSQSISGEKQLHSETLTADNKESNGNNNNNNKTNILLEDIEQQDLSKKQIESSTESSVSVSSASSFPSTHVRHQSQVFDIIGSVSAETQISSESDVELFAKEIDSKEKGSDKITKESHIKQVMNEKSAEIENKSSFDSKQKELTQVPVESTEKDKESKEHPTEAQLKIDKQSPIIFKDISEDSDHIVVKDTEKSPKPKITEKTEIKEYSATTDFGKLPTDQTMDKKMSGETKSDIQTDFGLSFGGTDEKISKDSDQLKYATDVKQISSETLVKESEKTTQNVTDPQQIVDESYLDHFNIQFKGPEEKFVTKELPEKQFDTQVSHSKGELITKVSTDKSIDNQKNIFISGTDSMPSTTISQTSQLIEKRDSIPSEKQVITKSEEISTEKEWIDLKDKQSETVHGQKGQNDNLSTGKSSDTKVESVFITNLNQTKDSTETQYQKISKDFKESEINQQKSDSNAFKTGQPFEESLFKDISIDYEKIDSKGTDKISEQKSIDSKKLDERKQSTDMSRDIPKDSAQTESTSFRDDTNKSNVQKEFDYQYDITEEQFRDPIEDKCEETKSDAKHIYSETSTKLNESLKDFEDYYPGDYAIATKQISDTKKGEVKDLLKEIKESDEKELNEKQIDLSFNVTNDETKDKQKNVINTGIESKTSHSLPSAQIKRTTQVVEPLYEDSDEEDNGSAHITEQTIVSSTLTADFPELISLSGGTTPSQSAPQSPLDSKSLSRSESVKSREKITIIDTIPEDKDNERYQTFDTNVTLIGKPSDSSKTVSSKPIESEKSLFESTSQQKDVKSHQKSDNSKTVDESKPKTVLKESSETEVVIIEATDSGNNKFNCDQWGQPLSLPTPPESSEAQTKILNKANVMKSNATNAPKVAKQGTKSEVNDSHAVYVELAYVPHHADQHYCNADYFKRVRAKYYVFSGINPHREVFEALIEGKKVWDKQFTTTVIPTHESESLGFWINNNRNLLEEYMIAVAPAADRCTVNLQDYETKCSAYRVEF